MTKKVPVIYSADWCSYCESLKNWLESKGIKYQEKNVDDPKVRQEMNERTKGNQTIPTMFIGDNYWVNPSKQILAEQFILGKEK